MARNHGRVSTAIWDDEDFIALPPGPQRMYMFLLSQRNLTHAGLLPLTMTRWASRCAGMTPASIKAELQALAAARFVVVDAAAEELLIRTLVKNDLVYKQPRIMQRLVEDAQEITSPKLRAALLAELDRLPLDELSDAPAAGKDKRSVRQVALDSIRAVRQAYGNPPGDPLPDPSEGVSQTLPDTHPEGSANGTGRGSSPTHTRVGAPSPHPLPPTPIPPTAGDAENGDAAQPTTQTLVAEWIDNCGHSPPRQVVGHLAKQVATLLAEGIDPAIVRAGLASWQTRRLHPSALPSVVHEVMSGPAPARASPERRSPGNPYLNLLRDQAAGNNVIALPALERGAS